MDYSQASELNLIQRITILGDTYAFEQLVLRNQSSLRCWLRRLTHPDYQWADDVAQDAFIQAYKKLSTFRYDSKFSTWLFKIAYRLYLRQAQKRSHIVNSDLSISTDIPHDNNLTLDVERALHTLKPVEQVSITLFYFHGLSHSEIADILDMPIGTVKTNILRSKEKLKSILKSWDSQGVHHE